MNGAVAAAPAPLVDGTTAGAAVLPGRRAGPTPVRAVTPVAGLMVVVDAVTRLIPGALGCNESAERDSFADGLLDYPHYTRPVEYRGLKVPDVLTSGHHGEIEKWRRRKAMEKTFSHRPDLLERRAFSEEERRLIAEILRKMDKQ